MAFAREACVRARQPFVLLYFARDGCVVGRWPSCDLQSSRRSAPSWARLFQEALARDQHVRRTLSPTLSRNHHTNKMMILSQLVALGALLTGPPCSRREMLAKGAGAVAIFPALAANAHEL